MADNNNDKNLWKEVISVLDSPLKVFGLVLFILNGILLLFAGRTATKDSKFLFILSFIGLFLLIIVFFILFFKQGKMMSVPKIGQAESDKNVFRYDFFLAAPMAAITTNQEYQAERNKILEIIKIIKQVGGFETCYYAGENIDSIEKFQTEAISVKQDLEAIKNSKYFIMVYTGKYLKPSSVIFEAGVAVALGKKSIYFSADQNLPFLMKQANDVFSHVKIHKANSPVEVLGILQNNGKAIFEMS